MYPEPEVQWVPFLVLQFDVVIKEDVGEHCFHHIGGEVSTRTSTPTSYKYLLLRVRVGLKH